MRILMVAPPGAGKGTQAARLADHYGIEHLSSGELLRREIAAGTEIGRQAQVYVERGDLVPDELGLRLILERAFAAAERGGYVLDGFPRSVAQAKAAHEEARRRHDVSLQAVVHLAVARDELIRRMRRRAAAEGRDDDTEAVIEHRLAVYDAVTDPLLEYYGERGILLIVDGDQPVDAVSADLFEALEGTGVRT